MFLLKAAMDIKFIKIGKVRMAEISNIILSVLSFILATLSLYLVNLTLKQNTEILKQGQEQITEAQKQYADSLKIRLPTIFTNGIGKGLVGYYSPV